MPIAVDLTPAQEERLRDEARRLGIPVDVLARVAIEDLLDRSEEDFQAAASHVLSKNQELYRRLS
jgi:antitoxin FitA